MESVDVSSKLHILTRSPNRLEGEFEYVRREALAENKQNTSKSKKYAI
jgi:hypothetical protein